MLIQAQALWLNTGQNMERNHIVIKSIEYRLSKGMLLSTLHRPHLKWLKTSPVE